MSRSVTIRRSGSPFRARITLPPSKSVANRALLLAALAGDLALVEGSGEAADTLAMLHALRDKPATIHCGAGGTTFRFLLAWACVQAGEDHLITGVPRLLERPHEPLVEALRTLGADITRTAEGYRVRGRRMPGGAVTVDASISSQFISALLLVAPCFETGLQLTRTGRSQSVPYVTMTLNMLEHFGVRSTVEAEMIHVRSAVLGRSSFTVPLDWSAAAFWHQSVALGGVGAQADLIGLHKNGWQGDERATRLWSGLVDGHASTAGYHLLNNRAIDTSESRNFDLQATPDLFQALAFTHAGLGIPSTCTGLHNLPLKETDRLQAVADALRVLGCTSSHANGRFVQTGAITNLTPPPFDPQEDHRMAMALAPLALVCEAITILHPEVVAKSYPNYWDDLRIAGLQVDFRG